MAKVLVSLSVPILKEEFDIFVPDDVEISVLIDVLAQGVFDASGGNYTRSGREKIMMIEPRRLMNPRFTLRRYGVVDGSCLMLV